MSRILSIRTGGENRLELAGNVTKDFSQITLQNWPFFPAAPYTLAGGKHMLKKDYVRDGNRKIIGSVTTGFRDTSAVVRDEDNKITGRTSERFQTTRDGEGNLISINSSDPALLIGRKK